MHMRTMRCVLRQLEPVLGRERLSDADARLELQIARGPRREST